MLALSQLWSGLKSGGSLARSHYLYDVVRTFGANKELVPNETENEGSVGHSTQNHGYVGAANSDGFTLPSGATNDVYTNEIWSNLCWMELVSSNYF